MAAKQLRCCVCGEGVAEGVLEAGQARHHGCARQEQELLRVTMSLARADVATFRELGDGNASHGARKAARLARSMESKELQERLAGG